MLDQSTLKGRIVAAALRLAAERPWREVALIDIAEAAGVDLAAMRETLASKSEILAAFSRMIDNEILKAARPAGEGQAPRDVLFEVVMSRFDALAPYKPALKSIAAESSLDPTLIGRMLSSQAWMLNAAGIDTDGIEGRLKVAGLMSVYASVFGTWLDDDDPGLARTMAALDRRLRRGERMLDTVGEVLSVARRVAGAVMPWPGAGSSRSSGSPTTAEDEPAATNQTKH